uniref:Phosphatidylcholine transfer protein n=1 Tax=Syphacia muris TaxID=451379 RepID=A0A0N5AVN8_9BILA
MVSGVNLIGVHGAFRWRPSFLVALSAGFSFENSGISDDVMEKERDFALNKHSVNKGWKVIVDQDDVLVVKREREDTGLNEYCCAGSYRDISARDFIDAQMDLEYRCMWDTHVIKLEVLDEDKVTDTQIIRWVSKYPYPLYPREYIFIRRRYFDEKNNCVIIVSSSLDENMYPSSSKEYVRVSNYHSVMVVSAHNTFEEKGFNYVLSYRDDPGGNIPKYVYNWLVNSGGPNFLKEIHEAARRLENTRLENERKNTCEETSSNDNSVKQKKTTVIDEESRDSFGLTNFFFLQRLFAKDYQEEHFTEDSRDDGAEFSHHDCELVNGSPNSVNVDYVYKNDEKVPNESQWSNDSVVPLVDD